MPPAAVRQADRRGVREGAGEGRRANHSRSGQPHRVEDGLHRGPRSAVPAGERPVLSVRAGADRGARAREARASSSRRAPARPDKRAVRTRGTHEHPPLDGRQEVRPNCRYVRALARSPRSHRHYERTNAIRTREFPVEGALAYRRDAGQSRLRRGVPRVLRKQDVRDHQ